MSIHSPSTEAPRRSTEALLATLMRWMLALGTVVPLLLWWMETRSGVILPWDRVLLLCLSGGFALCWLAQRSGRWPDAWVATAALCMLNGFLVSTFLAMMLWRPELSRAYQMVSVLFWLPVGFAAAHLFLPQRRALQLCVLVQLATFLPLGMAAWQRWPAVAQWPADSLPLLGSSALSLAVFTVLLSAVSYLKARAVTAEQDVQAMEQLATTDALTALANRRATALEIDAAIALSQRNHQPLALAMIDLDHFKRVNDRHGHAAGDAVLVQTAQILRGHLRASDRLGRWGGEEFVLVAPLTRIAACMDLAERLRHAVAAHNFPHGEAVTLSVGLTAYLPGDDAPTLLARADGALYRAKALGRNRVELQALALAPGASRAA